MKVPIRMIGIATAVFWVFLIIFSASALYSMKDIQFSLGQPQTSPTDDHELLFSFPVYIVNTGYYNLAQLNLSTKILDQGGLTIAQGSTFIPVIGHGETTNATHNMKLNLTDLLRTSQSLLFNDSELMVNTVVNVKAAEVIPVQASSNSSMPWGAPLYSLMVGTPEPATYNATHTRVTVPISFENHAFFDLAGTVQVFACDSANAYLTKSEASIQAPQRSPYKRKIELYVPLTAARGTRLEVFFVTQFFNYGPLVISFGG